MNYHLASRTHFNEFLAKNPSVEFVWVQFTTYIGTNLVRMLPVGKFIELIEKNGALSVPIDTLRLLPHDHIAGESSPTGTFYLKPDITSLHCRPDSDRKRKRAVAIAWWVDEDGRPIGECARSKLQSLGDQVQIQSGFSILVGFEVEVIFMKDVPGSEAGLYEPATKNHSWCSMTTHGEQYLSLLEEVVDSLNGIGIEIEHFHGELAPSQWEFVLAPDSPVRAVDRLIITRRTIMSIAHKYGLGATFHPRPFPEEKGTGAHVHISLNSETQNLQNTEPFFAGILSQFPAIAAFALPHDISYRRVESGISSGGLYCAWGWDNRETLLRRININHFELKMMDGLANPYLALSAMLAAGLSGLVLNLPLVGGNCTKPPSNMSDGERAALDIQTKIPTSLEESLEALSRSSVMKKHIGEQIVSTYLLVKKGELEGYRIGTSEEAHTWMISNF